MAEFGAGFHGQRSVRSDFDWLGAVYKTDELRVHEISASAKVIYQALSRHLVSSDFLEADFWDP